jgi:predicted lactoylglutathione lyase
MDSDRPGVTEFVHVGLVVEDLDETVRFLSLLGFDWRAGCSPESGSVGSSVSRT